LILKKYQDIDVLKKAQIILRGCAKSMRRNKQLSRLQGGAEVVLKNKIKKLPVCIILVAALIAGSVSPACFYAAGAAEKTPGGVMLIPGGDLFGISISTGGVIVAGISDVISGGAPVSPAFEAGLKKGDVILRIDGKDADGNEKVQSMISSSRGGALEFEILRGKERMKLKLTPAKSDEDGKYRGGIWIRDSMSGIGTVTYIDPSGSLFGGLGHGICDADTGELIPMKKGSVSKASLSSVLKGSANSPGEIHGTFEGGSAGEVYENTEAGVFGKLYAPFSSKSAALPTAKKSEVSAGKATVICTVRSENGENIKDEYAVEIVRIISLSSPTKNFLIRVCDERLLSLTGGIVQGMSGSPIIQNGKIVGAVTHVLVNDPAKGYGIFIENMLASDERS